MKIPGVYVTIAGDYTQLKLDMSKARQIVMESATGMSNAMNNALSPLQIQNGVNSLVRNLGVVQRNASVTGDTFDMLSVDLGELRKVTGLAEDDLQKLQSRLLQTKAAAATERALNSVARSAGLAASESAMLRLKLGDTAGAMREFQKVGVGAMQRVHDRVFNLHMAVAGLGLSFLVKDIYEVGRSAAALEKAYNEIAGSTEQANSEFAFLRTISDDLGQNFWVLADAYKGYYAAASKTNLESATTRDIFLGVTKAAATLGLTADETKGALNAITQMLSKGKVQAEELRGQLGERLPGAFHMAAEAMGVTTAELDKMLEQGKVAATDLLPKLGKLLKGKYSGNVDEATRATNKWNEAVHDLKLEFAEGGFLTSATEALTEMTAILKDDVTKESIAELGKGVGELAKGIIPLASHTTAVFSSVVNGWNTLPDVVKDIGIVGAIVGGAKARIAIALIAAAAGQIDKLNKQAAGVSEGDKTSALLNQELVFLENRRNALKALSGNDVDTIGPSIKKQIAASESYVAELMDKIVQARLKAEHEFRLIDEKTSNITTGTKAPSTGGTGGTGNDDKKKTLSKWADFERELTILTAAEADKRVVRIQEEFKRRRASLGEYLTAGKITQTDYNTWLADLNTSETQQLAAETERQEGVRARAVENAKSIQEDLTDYVKRHTLDRFEYEQWSLDQEYEARKKQANGEKAILDDLEKAYKAQSKKIADNQRQHALEQAEDMKQKAQDQKEDIRDIMAESDSVFAGLQLGLAEYNDSVLSTGRSVADITRRNLEQATDGIVGFMHGQKLEISSIVDSIIADFERMYIKQAVMQPMSNFMGSAVSSMSSWFSGSSIPQYANGGGFEPGWAMVGERGPELVRFGLPGRVYPADETRRMASGGGGSTVAMPPVEIHNYSNQPVEANESVGPDGQRKLMLMIGRDIRNEGPVMQAIVDKTTAQKRV